MDVGVFCGPQSTRNTVGHTEQKSSVLVWPWSNNTRDNNTESLARKETASQVQVHSEQFCCSQGG